MDRISRAEVGGPYASHDDAMRAIQNKGFDSDPADLTVQEGSSDDGDDTSKESSLRTQAKFPPPADSGGGATMKPSPEDPLKDNAEAPKDAENVDPTDDAAPDDTADPTAPDNGSSLPVAPDASGAPVDPLGDPETQVTTTKPAQIPSGGGGGMPGESGATGEEGEDGLPDDTEDAVGSEEDVSKPPEATAQTSDPVGSAIDQVTAQIFQDNPELPHTLARRVARKVVGRLVQADVWNMRPHIEDPLADKNPLEVIHDVVKTLPKGSPAAAPSNEDDSGDDDSSLPAPVRRRRRTPAPAAEAGAGEAAAGVGAAAEGAGLASGAAELAPLLLL